MCAAWKPESNGALRLAIATCRAVVAVLGEAVLRGDDAGEQDHRGNARAILTAQKGEAGLALAAPARSETSLRNGSRDQVMCFRTVEKASSPIGQ